ncbi:T9SS type A sorting domain-containing protein [Peijinzhouia sedimentorum]
MKNTLQLFKQVSTKIKLAQTILSFCVLFLLVTTNLNAQGTINFDGQGYVDDQEIGNPYTISNNGESFRFTISGGVTTSHRYRTSDTWGCGYTGFGDLTAGTNSATNWTMETVSGNEIDLGTIKFNNLFGCYSFTYSLTIEGFRNNSSTGTQTFSVTGMNSVFTSNSNFNDVDKIVITGADLSNLGMDDINWTSTAPSAALPSVSTLSATDLSSSGARLNGNVTADGGAAITERGFVYSLTSSDASPSFAEVNGTTVFKETVSGTTGAYNTLLSGLSSSTSYSYVAYATNSEGTTNGSVETFTTSAPPASLATVTTSSASLITSTSATLGGNVTDDGDATVTDRGIVYNTTGSPNVDDDTKVSIGGGEGVFSQSVTSLTAATTYYVRAYAINSEGIAYGSQESFTTLSSGATYTWTGSTDSDGGVAGNWSGGLAPPTGSDIVIPEGATPYPVFDFDFEAGDITIEENATLTIAPTRTLTFTAGSGASGDGKLILQSDDTGDASIGDLTGAGSIDVLVQQERFLAGGNRAFRFFSHPYTTAVPLSVLADSIDVTGVGGAANGFTPTATNAPSAFRFDPLNADGNEDNDGGWEAFTNTSQTIGQHEAIRILFRGSKGQANSLLDVGTYTPDPVTIEWEGTINQGEQIINLVGVAVGLEFSDWNLVGNPFPSAIDLSAATHSSGAVADFSVWRPRQAYTGDFSLIAGSGRGGAYLQEPLATSSVKIPSGGGFFIRAGGTTATLTIPEPAKTSVTPAEITNVLRMDNAVSKYGANSLQLTIEADGDFVDRILVFMDDSYTKAKDLADAPKLANPVVNFFTVSEDDWALAIDRRGYEETEGENRIPLHLQAPNYSYTLSLPDFDVEEGRKLRLYDRFTEEYITLQKGTTYEFEVTDDPSSKGHRFDIVMGIEVITSINPSNSRFQAFLLPNPAQEQVRISIQKPDHVAETTIKLVSMSGVEVRSETLSSTTSEMDVNLNQLSKGVYLVEITHGTARIVKRLIVN